MLTRRLLIRQTVVGSLSILATEPIVGRTIAPAPCEFTYLTSEQVETVGAICDRIWPPTATDLGAVEAGAVCYIDRCLSDAYRDLAEKYRNGIQSLNAYSKKAFGTRFPRLLLERQDVTLSELEKNAMAVRPFFLHISPSDFFAMILKHTQEGLFSDPMYGGNRDFAGWKAIGYTGPRYFNTAESQTTFAPLDLPMHSVRDM